MRVRSKKDRASVQLAETHHGEVGTVSEMQAMEEVDRWDRPGRGVEKLSLFNLSFLWTLSLILKQTKALFSRMPVVHNSMCSA